MDFKVRNSEFYETCDKTTKLYRSDYMGNILCHVLTLRKLYYYCLVCVQR